MGKHFVGSIATCYFQIQILERNYQHNQIFTVILHSELHCKQFCFIQCEENACGMKCNKRKFFTA